LYIVTCSSIVSCRLYSCVFSCHVHR
jgi:hypothetical protein